MQASLPEYRQALPRTLSRAGLLALDYRFQTHATSNAGCRRSVGQEQGVGERVLHTCAALKHPRTQAPTTTPVLLDVTSRKQNTQMDQTCLTERLWFPDAACCYQPQLVLLSTTARVVINHSSCGYQPQLHQPRPHHEASGRPSTCTLKREDGRKQLQWQSRDPAATLLPAVCTEVIWGIQDEAQLKNSGKAVKGKLTSAHTERKPHLKSCKNITTKVESPGGQHTFCTRNQPLPVQPSKLAQTQTHVRGS